MPLTALRRVGASVVAALLLGTGPAFAADFLDPAEAFRATADAAYARDRGAVSFRIESGYYLYRDRTSVRAQEGAALAGALQLPPGQPKFDPNFGSTMDIWKHELRLELPVPDGQAAGGYELQVQGCAEQGLCYPPQRLHIRQSRDAQGRVRLELTAAPVPAGAQPTP
ncbi:MAG TPA: protein-disulfide reductase DsbD N-terminal domain-containing protein, partial [Burkholderiaceae bacterium]|nr:protein-disulfide reductase DsbD N-terminal domain-containing protein [Burkholderiaceae bacterium]